MYLRALKYLPATAILHVTIGGLVYAQTAGPTATGATELTNAIRLNTFENATLDVYLKGADGKPVEVAAVVTLLQLSNEAYRQETAKAGRAQSGRGAIPLWCLRKAGGGRGASQVVLDEGPGTQSEAPSRPVVLGGCFASGKPRSGGSTLRDARGRDGTGARAGRDGAASFGGSLGEKGREGTGSRYFAKLPERAPLRRSGEEVAGRLRKDCDLGRAECGKRAACRRIVSIHQWGGRAAASLELVAAGRRRKDAAGRAGRDLRA